MVRPNQDLGIIKGENVCVTGPNETTPWAQYILHPQVALTPTVSEIHPMTPGQGQEYPVLGHQHQLNDI